jgi:hypothetical protein
MKYITHDIFWTFFSFSFSFSCSIKQEWNQQDVHFDNIKPEPVYEQLDIKQEVCQHECCQPTIKEEHVEPYQHTNLTFFNTLK